MNLLKPLELEGAKTINVGMTPTKRFFKPVLTFEAPIDPERAELLGASHLFDKKGNPQPFDGTYKLHGDLPLALVVIKPAGREAEVKLTTEKVAHFNFFREGKGAMRLSIRVHLPEEENQLLTLLTTLAALNKGGFGLSVIAAQGSLIPATTTTEQPAAAGDANYKPNEPDANGLYDVENAVVRPFSSGPVKAKIMTLDVEGGFIAGFEIKAPFKSGDAAIAGSSLNDKAKVFASESEAREEAVRDLWEFIKSDKVKLMKKNQKERHAWSALEYWLCDLLPTLPHAPEGEAAAKEVVQ